MKSPIPYLITLLFIFSWWTAAFHSPSTVILSPQAKTAPPPIKAYSLKPLSRDLILKALNGDAQLMRQLIFEWQLESEEMKHSGINGIRGLTAKSFWRAQSLAKTVHSEQQRVTKGTVLPQTELSAAVALALLPPEEIAAIPSTLREKTLFPKNLTDKIPLNIDRYRAEELFLKEPRVAFVAHYTDPNVLQTLRNQGIPLKSFERVDDLETICQAIIAIGTESGNPEKAELLALFVEAAVYAIDTRFMLWMQHDTTPQRILYLSYYRHFTVPTQKPLIGQLLKRSGLPLSPLQQKALIAPDWTLPVSQEEILADNSDFLILSSNGSATLLKEFQAVSAFETLAAKQLGQVAVVDDGIQQMISQHLVLAYLDLYHAITQGLQP